MVFLFNKFLKDKNKRRKWFMANIFFEMHRDMPRQGPGLDVSTLKAWGFLENLPQRPQVLDVGCGPGMQTIALASNYEVDILALDFHQQFLDELSHKIKDEAHRLNGTIIPVKGDMFHLDYPQDSFDVIWSEGAIYIMGFEAGIRAWQSMIKSGGYLVVSELSWLKQPVSNEIKAYWESEYPQITTVSSNISVIESAAYTPVAHFILPKDGWRQHYYIPLQERIYMLREKYSGDEEANAILDATQLEIDLFEKYSDDYGYVFYIMRK